MRERGRCFVPGIRALCLGLALVFVLAAPGFPDGGGAARAQSQGRDLQMSDPDWLLYRDRFIENGRVMDTGNDGVSHSEGQGYGMLLAVAFDDPETFGALWSWTRNRLWVRDDLSVAWLWEEDERPAVTDPNSAADGDILIAWALIRAFEAWGVPEHAEAARQILTGFKNNLVQRIGRASIIAAGIEGFDYNGGVIINPSYWVFPALTEIGRFDPDPVWNDLKSTGRQLLRNARFGARSLVPDWVLVDRNSGALSTLPEDVDFLFRGFGYNALRLPLYVLWDDPAALPDIEPIAELWRGQGDGPVTVEVDLAENRRLHQSDAQGYRAIRAMVACVAGRGDFPGSLWSLSGDEDYYSASLLLLTRAAIVEKGLECS